jgi:hypothetical protein
VSQKHLHIHCIIFEDDPATGIPPLIYAEDLSTNGTFLSRSLRDFPIGPEQRIGRKGGRVLLRSGDWLRISPTVTLRFCYSSHVPMKTVSGLTGLQKRETTVELISSGAVIICTDLVVSCLRTDSLSLTRKSAPVAMGQYLLLFTNGQTAN